MRNIVLGIFLGFCILSAQVVVEKQVVDNGGGFKEGSGYRSYASIGQPVIGICGDGDYTSQAGYITWLGIELEVKPLSFGNLPAQVGVGSFYPNPFNTSCWVDVSLPEPGRVLFVVYDIQGHRIFETARECKAGVYRLRFNAGNLPSGVYFYAISVGETVKRGKLMLVR